MEGKTGNEDEQHVPFHTQSTSPADFLTDLGRDLRNRIDIDTELAAILANYLVTAEPSPDAVAKAKDAIVTLAVKRANPSHLDVQSG